MDPRRLIFAGAALAAGAGALAAIFFVLLGHVEHQPEQVIYALAFF